VEMVMSGYRKIAVAIDLSSESAAIMKRARDVAAPDSEIHLIYVQEPMDSVYMGVVPYGPVFVGMDEVEENLRSELQQKLDEIEPVEHRLVRFQCGGLKDFDLAGAWILYEKSMDFEEIGVETEFENFRASHFKFLQHIIDLAARKEYIPGFFDPKPHHYWRDGIRKIGANTIEAVDSVGFIARAVLDGIKRPSRLVKNIYSYIAESLLTMFRIFTVYKAFAFFSWLTAIAFTSGCLLGFRFLYFYFTGGGQGHIQSLILAAVLLIVSVQFFAMGILADLISSNRKIVEEIQYRQRLRDLSRTDDSEKESETQVKAE